MVEDNLNKNPTLPNLDDASKALKKAGDDLEGVGKGNNTVDEGVDNSKGKKAGGCVVAKSEASLSDIVLAVVFGVVEVRADVGCTPNSLLNRSNEITNDKLKSIYNRNFRPDAKIGSGSTADALRYEIKTGNKVGGASHVQKVQDSINGLKNLKNNPDANLTPVELDILNKMLDDLINAQQTN